MDIAFLREFKRSTEHRWKRGTRSIPAGTKWNPGLTADEIDAYEQAVGFRFPEDVRLFLSELNGTTPPHVFSYPRDLEEVRERIKRAADHLSRYLPDLQQDTQSVWQRPINLLPIYIHRYAVCPPNEAIVCSIYDDDAIIYGNSLEEYLVREFLEDQ